MTELFSLDEFNESIKNNDAIMLYFSNDHCNVCKVLKPKLETMINDEFPKMKQFYCHTINSPELAAQNRIFSIPAILVFFQQKEYFRYGRSVSISSIANDIERPYKMMTE